MPFITKLADKALDGLVHSGKANAQCNIYCYWAGCIINQGICTGGWNSVRILSQRCLPDQSHRELALLLTPDTFRGLSVPQPSRRRFGPTTAAGGAPTADCMGGASPQRDSVRTWIESGVHATRIGFTHRMVHRNFGHRDEQHDESLGSRLNWLRAGVLGANDGIVSVAGLVVGVAGATSNPATLAVSGIAGLVAGALSMAGGEYVSVSTQRDTEKAAVRQEAHELATMPQEEERELAGLYEKRGLSPELAARVARELTSKDALAAHTEAELGIDPHERTNPWTAAWASCLAFTLGALLPLSAIVFFPAEIRVWACGVAVVVALAATGFAGARLGKAPPVRAMGRTVSVGVLTMVVAYAIGSVFGVAVG